MASLIQPPALQILDHNGLPAAGGTIDFYVVNTLTRKNTYQDYGLTVANSNPVVLNSEGRAIVIGTGGYRAVIKDALGNLIGDGQTDATLDDGAVSSFILPWLSASNLGEFLTTSGIGPYVAAQIAAVALLPGPTGPTGPASTVAGPTGATGPTGAAGSDGTDGSSGFVQCGVGETDINGNLTIAFGTAFPNSIVAITVRDLIVPGPSDAPIGGVAILSSATTGFVASLTDSNGIILELTHCAWIAYGT